jgi:hypothetical protein
MREESRRRGSTEEPPDLGFIRQAAYDRALKWGVDDLDADDIAEKVMDSAEESRRTNPASLPRTGPTAKQCDRFIESGLASRMTARRQSAHGQSGNGLKKLRSISA